MHIKARHIEITEHETGCSWSPWETFHLQEPQTVGQQKKLAARLVSGLTPAEWKLKYQTTVANLFVLEHYELPWVVMVQWVDLDSDPDPE